MSIKLHWPATRNCGKTTLFNNLTGSNTVRRQLARRYRREKKAS